jgi:hypothetical protein
MPGRHLAGRAIPAGLAGQAGSARFQAGGQTLDAGLTPPQAGRTPTGYAAPMRRLCHPRAAPGGGGGHVMWAPCHVVPHVMWAPCHVVPHVMWAPCHVCDAAGSTHTSPMSRKAPCRAVPHGIASGTPRRAPAPGPLCHCRLCVPEYKLACCAAPLVCQRLNPTLNPPNPCPWPSQGPSSV